MTTRQTLHLPSTRAAVSAGRGAGRAARSQLHTLNASPGLRVVSVLTTSPLREALDPSPSGHPRLTRGTESLVLFLLLLFVVVLPARLRPRFPVAVCVFRFQHVNGGGAGPAVVGEPSSPAASGPLRRCLYPLSGEGSGKLLCSLLQSQGRRHQGQVLQLVLLHERKRTAPSRSSVNSHGTHFYQ